jgi:ABC-2 type transport system permease protein
MDKIKSKQPSQWRAYLALTSASLRSQTRNPSTLVFGLIFPLVFILVFGLIGSGPNKFEVGVASTSLKSGPVYEVLSKVEAFDLLTDRTDERLEDELSKGQIPVIIDIQEKEGGYTLDVETTTASQNSATVSQILTSIIDKINNPVDESASQFVDLNTTEVPGRRYERIDFVLPGQLGFALLSTGVFGIAFTFISLRQTLVIKRLFATPIKKSILIFAEVTSRMVIAAVQALVIIGVGNLFFKFTLINGVWTLLAMLVLSIIGLLVFFGFGLAVSSIAKDENAVPAIANLVTLPQFLMAGTFFPVEAFPEFLQPIGKILPLKFLNDAMRKVAFEGGDIQQILPELLALLVWGIIVYAVVVKVFKWEQS